MAQNQPPAPPPPPAPGRSPQPSLGELVSRISENVSALVRGEIALAKAKAMRMATSSGLGAGLLGGAAVLGLFAFGLLLTMVIQLLAQVMPLWAGCLIVAIILLIIAAVLAYVGLQKLKAAKADNPDPRPNLKQGVETVRTAVAAGLERGNAQ